MPLVKFEQLASPEWQQSPAISGIPPDTVDCWRIRINAPQDFSTAPPSQTPAHPAPEKLPALQKPIKPGLTPLLSPDENLRATRFLREEDRQRYIISHAALNFLLSQYLHIPPNQLKLLSGPGKKPGLDPSYKLEFNISHSADCCALAFSRHPVGIDMEERSPRHAFEEAIPLYFSPAESDLITQSASRLEEFYLYWTRKESLLKATSLGLTGDLAAFSCLDGTQSIDASHIGSSKDWTTASFTMEDYTISLTHATEVKNIRFFDLTESMIMTHLLSP